MQDTSKDDLNRPFYDSFEIDLSKPKPDVFNAAMYKKPKKDRFWLTITSFVFVVAMLRLFIIDPFLVHGSSMEPTFDEGNYIIIDKLTYKLSDPNRGDVIVFDAPTEDSRYFIKRVIGLPGERVIVDGSVVQVYSKQYPYGFYFNEPYVKYESGRRADRTLAEDEYFVMGDNREVSSDSRLWGPLKRSAITGRALIRLMPLDEISLFPGGINRFTGKIYPGDDLTPPSNSTTTAPTDEIETSPTTSPKKTL